MSPGGDSRVGLDELTQSQAFLSFFRITFLRDWIAIVMYLLPEDAPVSIRGWPMDYNCNVCENNHPRMTEYFNPPLMAAVSSSGGGRESEPCTVVIYSAAGAGI
jgi:hypothetical protein